MLIRRGTDPFALWPQLGLEDDAGHAFYMGVELARAEIAWTLGKRFTQDQPLDWGCAADPQAQDLLHQCAPGPTKKRPGTKANEKGGTGSAQAAPSTPKQESRSDADDL